MTDKKNSKSYIKKKQIILPKLTGEEIAKLPSPEDCKHVYATVATYDDGRIAQEICPKCRHVKIYSNDI